MLQIIFFPEGTDMCPNAIRSSKQYAQKCNIEPYEYLLHPRVTGFSYITQQMLQGEINSLSKIVL